MRAYFATIQYIMSERIAYARKHHKDGTPESTSRMSPMERTVLKNLYLSFYFSQGNTDVQKSLLQTLCAYYPMAALREEFPSSAALSQKLTPKVADFACLPRILHRQMKQKMMKK